MKRALFICVDYNSEHHTRAFVKNIFDQQYSGQIDVVVVCNGLADGLYELEAWSKGNRRVSILKLEGNVGYFPGLQSGFDFYLAKNGMPDVVVVSNVDIQILENNFLEKLSELEYTYDILAPKIVNLDGLSQNPFLRRRVPELKLKFLAFVYSYYPLFLLYRLAFRLKCSVLSVFNVRRLQHSTGRSVIYAPHGSLIILNHTYFDKGGDLKHGCMLYGEELFLAETSRRKHMLVIYDQQFTVLHNEHVATGLLENKSKMKHMRLSIEHILKRFYT